MFPQNVPMGAGPMGGMMIPNIPENLMMVNQKFQFQTHLVVTDIHENATQPMIWEHFQKAGPIFSLKLSKNPKKGKMAFITYFNFKDAQEAERTLNFSEILGKKVRVLTYIRSYRQIKEANQGNLILKKLGEKTGEKDLQEYFKTFGEIISCKVMYDEGANKSRGYGYIQFKQKESANKVLEQFRNGEIIINNNKIFVEEFQPNKVREQPKNLNCLFICNLPHDDYNTITEAVLKDKLTNIFSEFGKLSEVKVRERNFIIKEFVATIVFDENKDGSLNAKRAKEALNRKDVLGVGKPFFISYLMTKFDIVKFRNEFNLHTKNLRLDVSDQEILNTFREFGNILRYTIRVPRNTDKYNAKYAILQFENENEITNLKSSAMNRDSGILNKIYKASEKEEPIAFEVYMDRKAREQFKSALFVGKTFNKHIIQSQPNMYPLPPAQPFYNMPRNMDQNFYQMQPFMAPQQQPTMNMNMGVRQPHKSYNTHLLNQQQGGMMNQPMMYGQGAPQNQQRKPNYQNQRPQPGSARPVQPRQIQAPPTPVPVQRNNLEMIENDSNRFNSLSENEKRNILGDAMFKRIHELRVDLSQEIKAKITGMLIDFSVFEVKEIIEMIKNNNSLNERILEALDMLEQSSNTSG